MIVNQGSVNMKAASSAQRSCSRRKQVLRTNIATGEKQYSEKSFSATYDSYSSEHTEGSLPSYSEQAGIYLPVTNTKERPETFELMGKLRLYLMNLRETLFEGIGRGFGKTLDCSTSGTYSLWRYVEYEEYTYVF